MNPTYGYLNDDKIKEIESTLTALGVKPEHYPIILDICDTYLSTKEWQLSFMTKERDAQRIEVRKKYRGSKDDRPFPSPSAQEARNELRRLIDTCQSLEQMFSKGLSNFLMIHYMDAPPSLSEAIKVFKRLNSELQNTLKNLSGQAGRSTNIARYNLISHLAGAYQTCFGRKPGYPNPSGSNGNPDGPFFRFVYNLITILDGKELKHAALNTNIRRVLDGINRVRLSNGSLGARHGKKVYHLAPECYDEIPDEA